MVRLYFFFFISFFVQNVNAQKTSKEYWDAYKVAAVHFDNQEYQKAAIAFEEVWKTPNEEEIANHRLNAAIANCFSNNEEKVIENLFKIAEIANVKDRRKVLKNYKMFDIYKGKPWWSELETALDARIQSLIDHHKNLKIFKHGRNQKYSAIRINKEGDTLANTFITIIPDGTGWGEPAATSQSQAILKYEYSTQDSIDHIAELDSISHIQFWEEMDTTGVIENESTIWMHPFRNNEFFKTELAPFPSIRLPLSDKENQSFFAETVIMNNWGTYSHTRTYELYQYIGEETRTYDFCPPIVCLKYSGVGENSKHGTSVLEYYFNDEYGFVEMNYLTYDGDVILFKMIEIEETP